MESHQQRNLLKSSLLGQWLPIKLKWAAPQAGNGKLQYQQTQLFPVLQLIGGGYSGRQGREDRLHKGALPVGHGVMNKYLWDIKLDRSEFSHLWWGSQWLFDCMLALI